MRRFLPLVFAVPLLLAACADEAPAGAEPSGVRGRVMAGPTCPVQTIENPCPDRPVPNAEIAVRRGGEVVERVHADAEGRFELVLQPGDYSLVPVPEGLGPPPLGIPLDVTVPAEGFLTVTLQIDTGIR